jgi:hypothetical protein
MAITYTWAITGVTKAQSDFGYEDVITHIRFDYTGTSDEVDSDGNPYTGVFSGAVPTLPPPEEAELFTSFSDLTEEDVIGWAQQLHPVEHMNAMIEKQIEEKKKSLESLDTFPWTPAEEPVEGE